MTTLLAIGDLHLGRPSVALPSDLGQRSDELGPEVAWKRCVDLAIDRRVDGVLLAGDLVDRSRDFFVAYGQLKKGLERLLDAGIPVIAVAGNHDTHVLPRLAGELPGLNVLGAGGQWQRYQLDDVIVLGWSFHESRVRHSPLKSLKLKPEKGPVVGLLHCDRDRSGSVHAPVSSAELEQAPVDAWLLGHIHQPDQLDVDRPIGYLGSATALRASETGARGPWLFHIGGGAIAADHVALAPLHYEALDIDCSDLPGPEALSERLIGVCRETVSRLQEREMPPTVLGLRVTLSGRHDDAAGMADEAGRLAEETRHWQEAETACFVQTMSCAVLPRIDLRRLASQDDPCALLARRLLALEDPECEEYARLVELGRRTLVPVVRSREFAALGQDLDDSAVAAWLERAGRIALARLLGQRRATR